MGYKSHDFSMTPNYATEDDATRLLGPDPNADIDAWVQRLRGTDDAPDLENSRNLFPFFSLPPEIRDVIYLHVLRSYCQAYTRRKHKVETKLERVDGRVRRTMILTQEVLPGQICPSELGRGGLAQFAKLFSVSKLMYSEAKDVFFKKIFTQVAFVVYNAAELRALGAITKTNSELKGHFADELVIIKAENLEGAEYCRIKRKIDDWMYIINAFLRAAGKSTIEVERDCKDYYDCLKRAQTLYIDTLGSGRLKMSAAQDYAVEFATIDHSSGWSISVRLGMRDAGRWSLQLDGDIGRMCGLWKLDEDKDAVVVEEELGSLEGRMAGWMSDLAWL